MEKDELRGTPITCLESTASNKLKIYNVLQIRAMEIHKWIESEKAGRDLGEAAYLDWVRKYAHQFRVEHWPTSEEAEQAHSIQVEDWKTLPDLFDKDQQKALR